MNEKQEDSSVMAEAVGFVLYGQNADIPIEKLGTPLFDGGIPCQE